MVSLLRKTRKKLLESGKIKSYLPYMAGEILLVVISILLAMQIDNWNEDRKMKKEEQEILKGLKELFNENLNELNRTILNNKAAYEASLKLLSFIHPVHKSYTMQLADSLIALSISISTYDPSTGVVDVLVNSGKLNLIRDYKLSNQLSLWSGTFSDIEDDEKIALDHIFGVLIPFLSKHINLKNTDPYFRSTLRFIEKPEITESVFKADYNAIMKSKEFENLIYLNVQNYYFMLDELMKMKIYLEETLRMIESNIK